MGAAVEDPEADRLILFLYAGKTKCRAEGLWSDGSIEKLPALARELVRETLLAVRRVALVEHDNHSASKRNAERFRQAASALRIEATSLRIERIDEIKRAFAAAALQEAALALADIRTAGIRVDVYRFATHADANAHAEAAQARAMAEQARRK